MKVKDLTLGYLKYIVEEDNYVRYENLYPALFEHYYKFWSKRKVHQSVLSKKEIEKNRNLIIDGMRKLMPRLVKFDPDINELTTVLFVGEGNTNGHAFSDNGSMIIWLPVETYTREKDVSVFATHEIIHGLHYLKRPEFYFKDSNEKDNLMRMLITEGIATYLTAKVTGLSDKEALWGNYLNQRELDKWYLECEKNIDKLKADLKDKLGKKENNTMLFTAADPEDICCYRAGYFLGLKLIEALIERDQLTDIELIRTPADEFHEMIYSLL